VTYEDYSPLFQRALSVPSLRKMLTPGLDLCTSTPPSRRRKDLNTLCALHGTSLRIQKKIAQRQGEVEGLYDTDNSVIYLLGTRKNGQMEIPDQTILFIFCHELAHAIQYSILRAVPTPFLFLFFKKFRNNLLLEQTAEKLASYIAGTYFKTLYEKHYLTYACFNSYFSKEDVLFLAQRLNYDPESPEVFEEIRALTKK
jgi:hypothetical protein